MNEQKMTLEQLEEAFRSQIDSIDDSMKEPKLYYMVEELVGDSTDLKNIIISVKSVNVDELETLLSEGLVYTNFRDGKSGNVSLPRFRKVNQ